MLIGREEEKRELLDASKSLYSEFVAVYGRRRVGKTFLVRETFDYRFAFQHSGLKNKATVIQLDRFRQSLIESGYASCPELKNWYTAFDALKTVINASQDAKKVVFIDEMPWLDRPNANFVSALENFWNSWASARRDILLIVCGSASSWILKKIIYNQEGLHNRVTHRIVLEPFSLRECEEYARTMGLEYTRAQLAECYMILGGVPFYWNMLRREYSVSQNIDELFFSRHDKLENEFSELYAALFNSPEPYIRIVTALAGKKSGLTRDELAEASSLPASGKLTGILEDLERCGFIRRYIPIGRVKKGCLFQLIDNFTLFYFQFIQPNHGVDSHFWTKNIESRLHTTWAGLAFERLCLQHVKQIKNKLGIAGVMTNEYAWYSKEAQIDLLIDRNDGIVNLCEMKFSDGEYEIKKTEYESLQNKKNVLKAETGLKKAVHFTYVTTNGLKANAYANSIQSQVTLDALFEK